MNPYGLGERMSLVYPTWIPWPEPDWHAAHPHPTGKHPAWLDPAKCQCCYVDQRIAAWIVAFARYL